MEEKHLLENERVITQSDGNIVTLTNLRLRYTDSEWGKAHIISIMLEKISSIEIRYKSKKIFFILAIIVALAGVVAGINGDEEFVALGVGAGVVFLIAYFLSRKHYLTIASDGGAKIRFRIKGLSRDKILDFVNQVEDAGRKRRKAINE